MTATTRRRWSRWTAAGALLATATATIIGGTGVANAAALLRLVATGSPATDT